MEYRPATTNSTIRELQAKAGCASTAAGKRQHGRGDARLGHHECDGGDQCQHKSACYQRMSQSQRTAFDHRAGERGQRDDGETLSRQVDAARAGAWKPRPSCARSIERKESSAAAMIPTSPASTRSPSIPRSATMIRSWIRSSRRPPRRWWISSPAPWAGRSMRATTP